MHWTIDCRAESPSHVPAGGSGPPRGRGRVGAHLLEIIILLFGMLVLSEWMPADAALLPLMGLGSLVQASRIEIVLLTGLMFTVFSLPVLLLIRFVPARLPVVLGALGWVLFVSLLIYLWKSQPVIREIREADTTGLLKDTTLVGVGILPLRAWLWALVSVLGGFYAVRRQFSYLRLIAGTVLAGLVTGLLLTPFAIWPNWRLVPLSFAAFALILVSLPLQRAALERLLGIRLGNGPATAPLPYSAAGSLAGHMALALIVVAIACSAAVNYFERVQSRTISMGNTRPWRSPADQNAFGAMKAYFRRGAGYPQVTDAKPPADHGDAQRLLTQVSPGTRQRILAKMDLSEWQAYLGRMAEFIRAFEAASEADYLQMPGAENPSFLNLRVTARAIGIRSHLYIRENRPADAVNDVRTLLLMGGLFRDHPTLVGQMIGVALRNIGTGTAWNLVAVAPDNREMLAALAAALDEVADVARTGLDYPSLKLGEAGTLAGPLIPNVELMVPAFRKAHNNALVGWMNFDLVRLATALERHRLDTGGYPDQLQELAPTYLKRLPREPLEGLEYSYTRKAEGRYELHNPAYSADWKGKYSAPLFLPPAGAPDAESTATKARSR